MNESQFQDLLDRYLQGKCTREEINLLHQFYDSFQEEALKDGRDAFDVWLQKGKIHRNIKGKIEQKDRQQYEEQQLKASKFRLLLKIAASVLIAFSLGIGSYIAYVNQPAPEIVWMEKSTQKGQQATIILTDGTKVFLNADSKLSFPEHFHTEKREVVLEGEAFFDVVKNSKRPFIIKSGNLITTVLGTSFNIKAFEGDPLEVTVATGRVKVNAQKEGGIPEEIYLNPYQQAYYDGKLSKREVDINQFIAWKEKIIHFDEVTLAEAVIVLERWFNVSIVIENETVGQCKFSGKYINDNLTNIMESLEHILGIRYRFEDGQKLIIEGKGCKSKN